MDSVLPSINKFGLTEDYMNDDNNGGTIKPLHSYDENLDDLENVEGFNEVGKKKSIYGFQLNNRGIYTRKEIKIPNITYPKDIDPKSAYTITIPKKGTIKFVKQVEWDIDIKLVNDKVSTKGHNSEIQRIVNSGRLMGNFVPHLEYRDSSVLIKNDKKYYISASKNSKDKRTVFEFHCEFESDKKLLEEPPVDSTFVIMGKIFGNTTTEEAVTDNFKINIKIIDNQ